MLRSVLKRYFFGFIEALASKGILNTLKKGITSAIECADLAILPDLRLILIFIDQV